MEYENKSATREILDVCNQLQANFDPNKMDWTMNELYLKIFCDPNLGENRLSFESFGEDMNWILNHGLISSNEGKLRLDEFAVNLLDKYFKDHREIIEK